MGSSNTLPAEALNQPNSQKNGFLSSLNLNLSYLLATPTKNQEKR